MRQTLLLEMFCQLEVGTTVKFRTWAPKIEGFGIDALAHGKDVAETWSLSQRRRRRRRMVEKRLPAGLGNGSLRIVVTTADYVTGVAKNYCI